MTENRIPAIRVRCRWPLPRWSVGARWALIAGLAAMSAPVTVGSAASTRPPVIRALFVGIDKYRYSEPTVPGAGFQDLRGAVGDVGRIKAALHAVYGLDIDAPAAGLCPAPANLKSASITLLDQCATRTAILAALDDRIKASAAGDTMLFYFAGHGGHFDDDRFDKSGHYDTILPYDARKPDSATVTDIIDRQIYGIVNRATTRGINVVTVFDSCDSDTATRDLGGANRGAPPLPLARADLSGDTPGATASGVPAGGPKGAIIEGFASGPGYRVHLGAADDGEEAQEVGGEARAGVFTTALVAAVSSMPQATFADIAAAVQFNVAQSGHLQQHPRAEGTGLQATLGGAARHVPLLDATPSNDGVTLAGGTLLNVTLGSRYALFDSQSAALREGTPPQVAGRVTRVDAASATLTLDAAPASPLAARLVARENAHAFVNKPLKVIDAARSADGRARVARALDGAAYAVIGQPAPGETVLKLSSTTADDADLAMYGDDGLRIATLGRPGADAFAGCLQDALQKVARVQALLSLRTVPQAKDLQFCTFDFAGSPDAAVNQCRGTAAGVLATLKVGPAARMIAINNAAQPRYVYVLGIDETYSVTMILPQNDGVDDALPGGQPRQRDDLGPDAPGRYHFVAIATDAPINAKALEQAGANRCSAGTRDIGAPAPRAGAWTVTVTEAKAE